jgi:hypothetical protein
MVHSQLLKLASVLILGFGIVFAGNHALANLKNLEEKPSMKSFEL